MCTLGLDHLQVTADPDLKKAMKRGNEKWKNHLNKTKKNVKREKRRNFVLIQHPNSKTLTQQKIPLCAHLPTLNSVPQKEEYQNQQKKLKFKVQLMQPEI